MWTAFSLLFFLFRFQYSREFPDNEKRKKKSNDRDGCIVIEPEGAVVDDLLEDIGDDVGDFPEQDAVAATTEPKAPKRRKKKVVNF